MKDGFVSSIRCPDWHHIWLFARNMKQWLPGGFGGAWNFLRSHLKPSQPQVVTAVSPWGIGSSGRLESCVYQLVMNMRVEEEERRWSSGKKPFSIGGLYIVWIMLFLPWDFAWDSFRHFHFKIFAFRCTTVPTCFFSWGVSAEPTDPEPLHALCRTLGLCHHLRPEV